MRLLFYMKGNVWLVPALLQVLVAGVGEEAMSTSDSTLLLMMKAVVAGDALDLWRAVNQVSLYHGT
jgi:hypothetical protein